MGVQGRRLLQVTLDDKITHLFMIPAV
jgi:hypothetical protein